MLPVIWDKQARRRNGDTTCRPGFPGDGIPIANHDLTPEGQRAFYTLGTVKGN